MDNINNIKNFHLKNKTLNEGINLIENGDYIISGNLTIEVAATLNVKNARLMFESNSGIICKGKINAVTSVFMAAPNFKTWNNVKITGINSNESAFNNCIFENGQGISIDDKLHGGTIFIENTGTCKITITGCTFKNVKTYCGGAIYCERSNPVIEKSLFENLIAENSGGAIGLAYNSSPQISWCTFRKSNAGGGGAIYCYDNSDAKISDCSFEECQADTGGAIYSRFSTNEIENCIFTKCRGVLKNAAGGGCSFYKTNIKMNNCKFNNCRAQIGAGIESKGAVLKLSNSDFNECNANIGSAMALSKDTEAKISKCNFIKCYINSENEDHKSILSELSTVEISDSNFFVSNECNLSNLITADSSSDIKTNNCLIKKHNEHINKTAQPQNILNQGKKAFQKPGAVTVSNTKILTKKISSTDPAQIPLVDISQYPGQIKIETDAGFEQSLDALAWAGIVFGIIILSGLNPSNSHFHSFNKLRVHHTAKNKEIDPIKYEYADSFIIGASIFAIGGLCLALRYSSHSYYVIDSKKKIITFNYIINRFKHESIFLKFSEIEGIALNSLAQLRKGQTIYNRRNAIITKSGKIINLNIAGENIGFFKIGFLESLLKPEIPSYQMIFNSTQMNYFNLAEQAKAMAAIFNCPYYEVPNGKTIGIKKENSKIKIYFKDASVINWNDIVMFAALFLILLLLVIYIIKITN